MGVVIGHESHDHVWPYFAVCPFLAFGEALEPIYLPVVEKLRCVRLRNARQRLFEGQLILKRKFIEEVESIGLSKSEALVKWSK